MENLQMQIVPFLIQWDTLQGMGLAERYIPNLLNLTELISLLSATNGKRREVPDWAIDNITFAVMHDPLMVSSLCSLPQHLRSINHCGPQSSSQVRMR